MTKSSWFYWIAGVALVAAGLNALAHTISSGGKDPDPKHYIYMAPEARLAELSDLEREINSSEAVTPGRYFTILARLEKLDEAVYRASKEENLDGRMLRERPNEFTVNFLTQDWVNRRDSDRSFYRNTTTEEVDRARSAAGLGDFPDRHQLPSDGSEPVTWAIFYTVGLAFAFGRFCITIEQMGGCWWQSALADWRFPFWLTIWFVGVFKYPTKIDVVHQVQRAYRFAVLVLSSTISIAGAGCATKRVNTEPDVRPSDPGKTLQINVDTVTWPSYIGGNGAVFHPEAVQQTSVTATASNGVYANIWHSTPLSSSNIQPNFGREIDGTLGWIGNTRGFGLGADLTWVGVTPIGHFGGDVLQFGGSISRSLSRGFGLSSVIQLVMPTRGQSPKRGVFFREGVNWGVSRGRFSLNTGGEVFHDSGAFGFEAGWHARGSTSLSVRAGDSWKIGLPIRWNIPIDKTSDGRRRELQGGLIVSWQP